MTATYIPDHLLNDKQLTAQQVADLLGVSKGVVQKRRQGYGVQSGPPLVFPPEQPGRWAAPCGECAGFSYVQVYPGRFCVCASCCGSGLANLMGSRRPGACVRDSMEGAVAKDAPTVLTSQALRGDKATNDPKSGWGARQKLAYDLALLGLPWQAVADGSTYCNANQARDAAKKYALRNGLPVPSPRKKSLSASAPHTSSAPMADAPKSTPTIPAGAGTVSLGATP